MDILNFFNENFWLVATLVSVLTLPITAFINSKFNLNKVWKQVCAWCTSIVLTVGVYFGQLATFNNPVWVSIPLTGLVCGLSANGLYDIPTIKAFVTNYFSVLPKKKE